MEYVLEYKIFAEVCGFDAAVKYPDSKVHGANMGPTWGRQDPSGSHVGPMNFAIWGSFNPRPPAS